MPIEDIVTNHTDCRLDAIPGEAILFFVNQKNYTDKVMGSVDMESRLDAETGSPQNLGALYLNDLRNPNQDRR